MTVSEIAGAVRGGEVSAVELIEAEIDRIETVNPDLNAIANIQQSSPPTEWLSSDLKAFDADVYTGLVQAAAPLARQVRAKLEVNRLLENNSTGDGIIEPQQVVIAANPMAPEFRLSVTEQFS